jgi:hypothetical protein
MSQVPFQRPKLDGLEVDERRSVIDGEDIESVRRPMDHSFATCHLLQPIDAVGHRQKVTVLSSTRMGWGMASSNGGTTGAPSEMSSLTIASSRSALPYSLEILATTGPGESHTTTLLVDRRLTGWSTSNPQDRTMSATSLTTSTPHDRTLARRGTPAPVTVPQSSDSSRAAISR